VISNVTAQLVALVCLYISRKLLKHKFTESEICSYEEMSISSYSHHKLVRKRKLTFYFYQSIDFNFSVIFYFFKLVQSLAHSLKTTELSIPRLNCHFFKVSEC